MRTDQLVYLREIHQCSSLNKASENLHISTQALSLSIKSLENELSFQVLDRSRTGVSLTEKGLLLLQYGDEFLNKLGFLMTGITPSLRTYFPSEYSFYITKGLQESFWPKIQSQLFADFPQSVVSPIEENPAKMFQLLSSGSNNIDFGLINQVMIDEQPLVDISPYNLSFQAFESDTYGCAVSNNLRISNYKSISLSTIVDYPIVLYEPSYPVLEPLIRTTGKKANILRTENYQIFRQLVSDGRGITFSFGSINSINDANYIPNTRIIPINDSIVSQIGYVFNNTKPLSTKSLAVISYLNNFINNQ